LPKIGQSYVPPEFSIAGVTVKSSWYYVIENTIYSNK